MQADMQTMGELGFESSFPINPVGVPFGSESAAGQGRYSRTIDLGARIVDLITQRSARVTETPQATVIRQADGTTVVSGGPGSKIGDQADKVAKTFSDIVTENPMLVLGAGAALLLLFMKPPSRRG